MNKRNYSKELDKLIESFKPDEAKPKLLLHVCCAPCSSYCLEYLEPHFDITVFFYNPNIDSEAEYIKRAEELRRFVKESGVKAQIIIKDYDSKPFYEMARGLEKVPEGGERCFSCYELRMREAAAYAAENGFDYFTTTLSISPLKNSTKINDIGEMLSGIYGVKHLPSDFKKKEGYKRSIELSREYNLYRQNYCGCVYSKREETV
ncbi:epoxyqueuosine reductase QueH [Lachnospiraceae bacterium C1.1]|nr:epoxyqueuosine reductase QueH [Lachnospiraceae bacterium C1.1]